MKVKIMSGISGSGKSTYIKNHFPDAMVCSADHFFLNEKGEYVFDVKNLSKAHGECLKKFVAIVGFVSDKDAVIVVDNTNTTPVEIAPYAQLALAYGHELEIVMIEYDSKKACARNEHEVPLKTVEAQAYRLNKLESKIPRWWNLKKIAGADV